MGMDFSEVLKGTDLDETNDKTKGSDEVAKKISFNEYMECCAEIAHKEFLSEIEDEKLFAAVIDGISTIVSDSSYFLFYNKIDVKNEKDRDKKFTFNPSDLLSVFLYLSMPGDVTGTHKIIKTLPSFRNIVLAFGVALTKKIFGDKWE